MQATIFDVSNRKLLKLNVVLAALVIFFLLTAAADLENFRPVSGDESWILLVSDTLAREGRLGNDMFRGYFNAERHYFFSLPLQYYMHAAVFEIAGTGVAQARWVSVAATFVTLFTIAYLALKWFGLRAALCTALLFVLWRNNLTNQDSGMTLLGVSRSARYDITPVVWMWLAVYSLDRLWEKPGFLTSVALGAFLAAAALTQYFGVFIGIGIVLLWLFPGAGRDRPDSRWGVVACAAFLAVIAPFSLYVLQHLSDAAAQFINLHAGRTAFIDPGGIADRLIREPHRYSNILSRTGLGNWVLVVGFFPVAAYIAYLAFRRQDFHARLLFFCLLGPVIGLALIDTTKAPIYAVVLLPALALTFGKSIADIMPGRFSGVWNARLLLPSLAAALFAALLLEGVLAYSIDRSRAVEVTPYAKLGKELRDSIPATASVAGPARWGWAMRSRSYLSTINLVLQWKVAYRSGAPIQLHELVGRYSIEYLLITDSTEYTLRLAQPSLKTQFDTFQRQCTAEIASWNDKTYGQIQVVRVQSKKEGCV